MLIYSLLPGSLWVVAPVRVPVMSQIELFNLLLGMNITSIIKNLTPYKCVQIIYMMKEYLISRIINAK